MLHSFLNITCLVKRKRKSIPTQCTYRHFFYSIPLTYHKTPLCCQVDWNIRVYTIQVHIKSKFLHILKVYDCACVPISSDVPLSIPVKPICILR